MFQTTRTQLRIPDINDVYGVALRDVNGDQRTDMYLVGFRSLNRLLVNQGPDQTFRDMTIQSGLGGDLMPMDTLNLELSVIIVDYDNDGDGDVMVSGWGQTTDLLRNEGKFTFQSIRDVLPLPEHLDANGCIAADVNNDGYLDIFLTDEHFTNRLWLNNGNGTFQDFTSQSGLEYYGTSQGAGFCDVDSDGDPDLYVTNWFGPDLFYRNLGDGRFRLMFVAMAVCQGDYSTNGVSFGDVDNDGDFDLFVTNRLGRNFLYRNDTATGDSSWVFVDVSEQANVTDVSISYGSVMADFNNDGWLDIFVTNVGPNRFYLNRKDGTFIRVFEDPPSQNHAKPGYSTGAACGDLDGDGDLDLVVANKDTFCVFYVNPTDNDAYVRLQVKGIRSNRDAIGTTITLYTAGHLNEASCLLGTRGIFGGSGYFSFHEPVVHVGLDTALAVDASVRFPSGRIVTLSGLRVGQTVTVFEYPWLTRSILLTSRHVGRLLRRLEFWYEAMLVLVFLALTYVLVRLGLRRYHWTPPTATGYLAGFFLMAFIVMLSFQRLGRLPVLLSIDILTVTFFVIFMINSERLYRLRQMKERYRSVLIDLGHQIIHLHDDEELLTTVAENLRLNSEFDRCCILLYDEDKKKFIQKLCRGKDIDLDVINARPDLKDRIALLRKKAYLIRSGTRTLNEFFDVFAGQIVMAIQRNHQFFGCLLMDAQEPVASVTPEDVGLYQSIANQMAIALENNAYIRRSNEMIQKLTEAKVQKKYLRELEAKNKALDNKNQELQKLYDELKSTETQLIHSEKMASLGQLVAGISHELNNPVGYIYSNVKQLKSYVKKIDTFLSDIKTSEGVKDEGTTPGEHVRTDKIRPLLPDIRSLIDDTILGSQMVKTLVHSLRTFSHLDQAEWKKSDIHQGIDTCLMILNPELKDRILVHKEYRSTGVVECNIGQLNQVFLNLLSNAAQAIEGSGNVWIRTKDTDGSVVIEIKDDGSGIPQDIQPKIFDPFFSTKDVGKGIGLGLSISYSIVKNHNGTIEVESGDGEGSLFTVILPMKR